MTKVSPSRFLALNRNLFKKENGLFGKRLRKQKSGRRRRRRRKTQLFFFLFCLKKKMKKNRQVAKLVHDQELSVEERNLLSVAFKNVIGELLVFCSRREIEREAETETERAFEREGIKKNSLFFFLSKLFSKPLQAPAAPPGASSPPSSRRRRPRTTRRTWPASRPTARG